MSRPRSAKGRAGVEGLRIFDGACDGRYHAIGEVRACARALTMFSPMPSLDAVDWALRDRATSLGAGAIIEVRYESGLSWSRCPIVTGRGIGVILL